MRTFLAIALVLAGCGGSQKSSPPPPDDKAGFTAPRLDLHCTPQADFDEQTCAGRGPSCAYGPPLICRGIDVPDEVREEERRAYEAGTEPCQCICEDERLKCAMVP